VAHRKAGDTLPQLYLVDGPGGVPQQLTRGDEPVWQGGFEPRDGRYLVFERASGGNEAGQLHRLDLDTRQTTLLTPPDERHSMMGWLHGSAQLLVASVPLDRTAQGGRRSEVATTLWLTDPSRPGSRRVVATLPGGGWFGAQISRNDRQIALMHYRAATDTEVWVIDMASGDRRRVLPAPGLPERAAYQPGPYTADDRGLWVASDHAGEFLELMRLDLADGRLSRLSSHIPWDATDWQASEDGRTLAARFNVDGREELRLFDAATGAERPAPRLPAGSVKGLAFHRGLGLLALQMDRAQGPGQVVVLDPATGTSQAWTTPEAPPGVDPSRFGDQQVIRWSSFDGRTISGLINRPPARHAGRRPVLIEIHGGPEAQAQVGFLGRWNYFVEEMGLVVIQPNVRGSSGYGKTFLDLDNGRLREDSVKDIGALLDWIARQPDLDPSRVIVSGGSYGGYMALASLVHHGDRLAGGIDDVGISHFVTFLQNTESYRRDLRRVEYGDERDPEMRGFLDRISPLTNAARIRRPLLVVQGRNDPRVPYTEAEQIVERVRATGTPVWYLRAENEGHGFARKENADYRLYVMVTFIEHVLRGG
jgi:dipeptidyl aminopeptidase/acylaminoacyl peptidase